MKQTAVVKADVSSDSHWSTRKAIVINAVLEYVIAKILHSLIIKQRIKENGTLAFNGYTSYCFI